MSMKAWIDSLFGRTSTASIGMEHIAAVDPGSINPATGLPMVGGFDVISNPWGTNFNEQHDAIDGHASGISQDIGDIRSGSLDHWTSIPGSHDPHWDW